MSHGNRLASLGLTTRAVVDRIRGFWDSATDADREAGARWYQDAEALIERLASQSGRDRETVAAVVAHLSPKTRWIHTVSGATSLLLTGHVSGHIGANVKRAHGALESDTPLGTLKGPKTRRFALNMLGDSESVTVDIWAFRVALGDLADDPRVIRTPGLYEAVEHCFRLAARRVGIHPATMQATTWIVARNGRSQ